MNTRVNELLVSLEAFGKGAYSKAELLPEMLKLQEEMIELTFKNRDIDKTNLKIWDVESELRKMNANINNCFDTELDDFIQSSREFSNLIKAEISGNRGEAKTFSALERIRSNNMILKNVELNDGVTRSELDAIVITPKAITIVEVKNTKKNIYIDEEGNYFRVGKFLRRDCNIVEKFEKKEKLLREALENKGIKDAQINRILVFTDNRIEIQSECTSFSMCFLSQLPRLIDKMESVSGEAAMSMEKIESAIEEVRCKEAYIFDFDVDKFKKKFALVLALIEGGGKKDENIIGRKGIIETIKEYAFSNYLTIAGKTAAAVAVVSMVIDLLN